jgi:hypothetical protein
VIRDSAPVGRKILRIEETVSVAINNAFPGPPWLAAYDITIVEAEHAQMRVEHAVYTAIYAKAKEIRAI